MEEQKDSFSTKLTSKLTEEPEDNIGRKIGRKLGEISVRYGVLSPVTLDVILQRKADQENPDKALQFVNFKESKVDDNFTLNQEANWGFVSKDRKSKYNGEEPNKDFILDENTVSFLSIQLMSGGFLYGKYHLFEQGKVGFELHYEPHSDNFRSSTSNKILSPSEKSKRGNNYLEFMRGLRYLKELFVQGAVLPQVDYLFGVTNKEMATLLKRKFPDLDVKEIIDSDGTTAYEIGLSTTSL